MKNETRKPETSKEKYLREQAEMRVRNIEFYWKLLTDPKTHYIAYQDTKRKLQLLGEL